MVNSLGVWPNPNVDRNHCYECGSTEVAFASLYPLGGVKGENNPPFSGVNLTGLKYSKDFNVCAECYYDQWQRYYPGEPMPPTVLDHIKET